MPVSNLSITWLAQKRLAKMAGSGSIAASVKNKRPENQNDKFAASAAVTHETGNFDSKDSV
jgi:hypothetical protein